MSQRCDNCGEPLAGDYCYSCGQPRRSPIVSVGELIGEFFRDVLSFDSRAWYTLRTLMLHPGRMTKEYVAGRRVAFTPPVRLYLLTSLLFLAIVKLPLVVDSLEFTLDLPATAVEGAGGDGAGAGDEATATPDDAAAAPAAPAAPAGGDEAAAERAVQRGIEAAERAAERIEARALEAEARLAAAAERAEARAAPGGPPAPGEDPCSEIDIDLPGGTSPAVREFLVHRIEKVCRRLSGEGGGQLFVRELIDSLPTMMLVLLPIMAAVLVLLYPFGGRRYVEHLILLTHFHCFVFLLVGATVVLTRLPPVLPAWGWVEGLTIAFTSTYTPFYLYKGMRDVYGQGRILTLLKFVLLTSAYLAGLTVAFAVGVLMTLWSFSQ